MRPLHLVPALMEGEPVQSFASRVARRNGVDMPTFCSDLGIPIRGLVAGHRGAIGHLSELTGIAAATLARRAFRPCGGTWLFGDQVLHRTSVRRMGLAVCPLCLRDDVAGSADPRDQPAHVRAHWLVRAVRACPIHGCALTQVEEDGTTALFDDRYHDLAARIAPTLGRLDRLVDTARPGTATRLEGWIARHMGGHRPRGGKMLDAMPLYAATRTCEMLGVVALFGPHVPLRSLDDAAWRAAGEVGFDVASLGDDAVASCLVDVVDAHGVASRNAGPTKAFGSLYRWLRSAESGPAYEPLRAILRRVVFDAIPLPAGTEILGVALAERRVHSLRSAGIETGQGVKDMRRALRARGVLPSVDGRGAGKLVAIGVEQAEAAREDAADSVPRGVAGAIVGATAADVRRLAGAGLLGPDAKVRRGGENRLYSRRELARFLGRLSEGVTGVEGAAADMCDIPTAAFRTHRGLAAIAAMVVEGRLARVTRAVDGHGFRAIRVDAGEVLDLAGRGAADERGIDEVAAELRITRFTALALTREGHLAAARARSRTCRREVLVVGASDLAAFGSTYASLSTLAWRERASVNTVKARLDASGVAAAFPGGRMRSAIYRIEDLDRGGRARIARVRRTRAEIEAASGGRSRREATGARARR